MGEEGIKRERVKEREEEKGRRGRRKRKGVSE
jgi:hypothetical protein